jgi:L-ascorbate metabolism protein UlaG (beta-lactamase superfamily)
MKYQTDFTAVIHRFGEMGEKTGWTYIIVPSDEAQKMHAADKKGFRVKGKLHDVAIAQVALMPMGEGDYVLPINASMRKQLKQSIGASIRMQLSKDESALTIDDDFQACLAEEPEAQKFFNTLAPSHQKYFSKWIAEAKTEATKTKRLAQAIEGLSQKMDYATMIRWGRENNKI